MEAMDASEEQFGTKRLLDALNQSMAGTPEDTVKSVMDSIGEFTSGCERADDITMLCFYYNSPL